jgi:O-antigen biosynthesis protein
MRAIVDLPTITASPARPAAARRPLALQQVADGRFVGALPAEARGRWCRIEARLTEPSGVYIVRIGETMRDASASEVRLSPASWPCRRRCSAAIAYIPAEATSICLSLFGHIDPGRPVLSCRPISYTQAALAACARHPARAARALARAALSGPHRRLARLRRELGVLALETDTAASYGLWTKLFDGWTGVELRQLLRSPSRPCWPEVAVFVFHAAPPPDLALGATLEALDRCPLEPPRRLIGPGGSFARALAETTAEYIAVLQSGEVLPPHTLPLLAEQAVALGRPDILYADEDALAANGERCDPVFKPSPSRMLMLSGTLARGVWLVRRTLLHASASDAQAWAETLRLDAWLRLHEAGHGAASHRVPHVLTHRRPDAESAPAAALAEVVRQHLARTGFPAHIEPGRPLRVRLAAPRDCQPLVSLIVPSACRALHVLACLRATLSRTDYTAFEVIVVVAGSLPPDRRQQAVLARLGADRRVRPLVLQADRFNYAAANNAAAQMAEGTFICLLNDDVAPLQPGWLAAMVGHLADPQIGIVGARLLYPDRSVQHAGIALRPDGTGEHMHRFLRQSAPGYAGHARLSQEVSAVTGACLLTRRDLYDSVGGLDESFASAFNDIDFCLSARAAGWGVVVAAEAELIHYESLTYGRHYAEGEEARAAADRARMLARWGPVCANDPFHNPNLGRYPGGLWLPAFPPRVGRSGSVPALATAA